MSRFTYPRSNISSQPNVIPMIDIMLVLLIIFMVVTPLLGGFKASMPVGENLVPRPEEKEDVTLGLDESGNYFLNGLPVSAKALGQMLRPLYIDRADKVIYFRADKNLPYTKIQDAIEIVRHSGVRVLAAITECERGRSSCK